MNLYHCMIELRQESRALAFAKSAEAWMAYLHSQELISGWRLLRRKFGLASGQHTDFLLEIEVPGLSALDTAFSALATSDETAIRLYDQMHSQISRVDVGLYRPYPDAAQRERIALI